MKAANTQDNDNDKALHPELDNVLNKLTKLGRCES